MKDSKVEEWRLVTIHGYEIIIETDEDNLDDVYDSIYEKLDNNDLYCVGEHSESARFKGHELSTIDFKKIIGIVS